MLAFLLPPIALFSLLRASVLRANREKGEVEGTASPLDIVRAAGLIAADLFSGRSKSGLLEVILFAIGALATVVFIATGFASFGNR